MKGHRFRADHAFERSTAFLMRELAKIANSHGTAATAPVTPSMAITPSASDARIGTHRPGRRYSARCPARRVQRREE